MTLEIVRVSDSELARLAEEGGSQSVRLFLSRSCENDGPRTIKCMRSASAIFTSPAQSQTRGRTWRSWILSKGKTKKKSDWHAGNDCAASGAWGQT